MCGLSTFLFTQLRWLLFKLIIFIFKLKKNGNALKRPSSNYILSESKNYAHCLNNIFFFFKYMCVIRLSTAVSKQNPLLQLRRYGSKKFP